MRASPPLSFKAVKIACIPGAKVVSPASFRPKLDSHSQRRRQKSGIIPIAASSSTIPTTRSEFGSELFMNDIGVCNL